MRKTSIINVVLITILLTSTVLIFSLLLAEVQYDRDTKRIEAMLADRSIENYFTNDRLESSYTLANVEEPVVLNPLCTDCDESIANMYNSGSTLIIEAPEGLCDVDVERCVLYNFDPFGLGIFERQVILRNQK